MKFFSKKKKISAGLAISGRNYRYLSLEGLPGKFSVSEEFSGDIPEKYLTSEDPFSDAGAYLDSVFKLIASSIPNVQCPVNFGLPISDSLLRIVNLPGMTLEKKKNAFRYEFENYFPFPASEGVYDVAEINYPLNGGKSERRFIVAATRRQLIDNITRAALESGIKLESLEPAQIALERAATPWHLFEESCVYIYVGHSRSVLILSWQGSGIFYRNITQGFSAELIAKGTESDEYKDHLYLFARDARSTLQFAISQNRSFETKSVYIFGPAASASLGEVLKESLSYDTVMRVDPMKIHGLDLANNGEWDAALGLAMRC